MQARRLVVFGTGNFISDIFDAALARGLVLAKVVRHLPEPGGERDVPLAERLARLAAIGTVPEVVDLERFVPGVGEDYILGITDPARQALAEMLGARFGLRFCRLVHPAAHVSPLTSLGAGTFVGAASVVGPNVQADEHVVVNRGATVGHDTVIGSYARIQPGATVCGLVRIGEKATVGAGATVIERRHVGEGASIAAGAVVVRDVPARTLVAGVPARHVRDLP